MASGSVFLLAVVFTVLSVFHPVLSEKTSVGLSSAPLVYNLSLCECTLTNSNGSINVPGSVPGLSHMDLQKAGIIGDPFYRYNDRDYRWISLDDWEYTLQLPSLPDDAFQSAVLVFEGLDTAATVTLNGKLVASTNNMFRRYMFEVGSLLQRAKQNVLSVQFASAENYALKQVQQTPYQIPFTDSVYQHGEPHRNFIRKAQCHFSWDWGPCFLTAGIWRPAYLLFSNSSFISSVAPSISRASPSSLTQWNVNVAVEIRVVSASPLTHTVTATLAGQTKSVQIKTSSISDSLLVNVPLTVSNVDLWYPTGYGSPTLYNLTVTLDSSSSTLSQSQVSSAPSPWNQVVKRVGFRDVKLVQNPIEGQIGLTFYVEINDIAVFAKGSNWIPMDSFETRVTPQRIRQLLQSAKDANMNIVRNWGGGIYQHDAFYDTADEMGLMVWEEFMFACAMYPRDRPFLETVSKEVRYQVRRLMSHPSLIIWSANNENEAALSDGWYRETRENALLYAADYNVLYDSVRAVLLEIDQTRPWLPSSPSNGIIEDDPYVQRWGSPQDTHYGDVHYYNYYAPCTNVSFFPRPRFASEYGFQSFPSLPTWQPVTLPSDLSFDSPLMVHRQHHKLGMYQLVKMMEHYFSLPSSLPLDASGLFEAAEDILKTAQEFGGKKVGDRMDEKLRSHDEKWTRSRASGNATSFSEWIYLTQTLQTLCIGAESEHYRRLKGDQAHTMGAIYWQLNDIWQAPTWSSTEFGGRWKMLHYSARRFFSPVLVSAYEDPLDSLHVYVTSDLTSAMSNGSLVLTVWSWKGQKISESTVVSGVQIQALQSKQVYGTSISSLMTSLNTNRTSVVLTFQWTSNVASSSPLIQRMALDNTIQSPSFSLTQSSHQEAYTLSASNLFYPSSFADADLQRPTIKMDVVGFNNGGQEGPVVTISVVSSQVAPFVFLQSTLSGRFSDNGILLLKDTPVILQFFGWESFTSQQFQQSLSVQSLSSLDI